MAAGDPLRAFGFFSADLQEMPEVQQQMATIAEEYNEETRAFVDLMEEQDYRVSADLLEIMDDRVGTKSTIITSQLPVEHWHEYLNDPTLADAILDRIVHQSHKIKLKGESMRKQEVENLTEIGKKLKAS